MKRKLLLLAGLLVFLARGESAEQSVALRETPPAVQAAIKSAGISDPIKQIVRHTRDGVTTYDVEFERNNAPNRHLRLSEDGQRVTSLPVIPGSETMWPAAGEYPDLSHLLQSPLKFTELPAAVQNTIATHARGREIADIDRERWKGAQVYEVEFKEPGLNPQIHVAEDGALLQDEHEKPDLKSLFRGTQLEDTPPAVQETVRRVAGDRVIVDIDRRGPLNRSVYLVDVRTTTGLETLHIAENGKLLQGSREGTPPARK